MEEEGESALEAARAEIVRLEGEAAESFAESERLREELRAVTEARDAATAARDAAHGEVAGLRAAAEEAARGWQSERDAAAERERSTVARYRELALRAEPALPAELIAGESIDAIDAAMEAARGIVQSVREQIATSAQDARVPAGAPPRGAPDVSAMTPEQKIRYGLSRR